MNRSEVLSRLNANLRRINVDFGVKSLSLFGSAARDELREGSDIDVLVEFAGEPTFDAYMDLKFFLEKLFGTSVDLVTVDAIRPRMRPIIERDLIHVS
jgi:hypothetical protein